jgi:hypothetical protein
MDTHLWWCCGLPQDGGSAFRNLFALWKIGLARLVRLDNGVLRRFIALISGGRKI